MNSKSNHPFRTMIQALTVLVILFTAAASASTANAATPPVSDEFTTAPKMTASYNASITDMTGATTDGGFDPTLTCDGGSVGEASLWYTYTALTAGEAVISTNGSAYDTVLTIWKSDPFGNLIEVGCNDDATGLVKTSAMTIALRGGIKYYVEVTRKTGTSVTPPDKLVLSFRFASKMAANPMSVPPFFYDGSSSLIYYSPVGWQVFPVIGLPVFNGGVHVGNNPGDSATFYFDGSYVQLCYVTGNLFGNMNVYIDEVHVATIGQNAGVPSYICWDTPMPPIPGSASILDDNVHKLVLKNAGPGKVNIDTLQVFAFPDFWPPDPIVDLTATTGTASGRVTLKWTATGDDGMFGRVAYNQIRYRTSSFFGACPADWNSASTYTLGTVTPLVAGSQQSITLSGLAPGVTYYFMVVGVDEAGNIGDPCSSSEATAVASAPAAVGPGFYDDKSAYWSYTGTWKTLTDSESLNNSLHQANKLGSTASFYFTGTQFRLAYWATPNQGLVDVYLDGAYLTTIDQYTPAAHARIYVSPVLVNGPHSVQFIQQSLPYINIDGIYIAITTDGGAPDAINDLVATQGFNAGEVDLTWTATGDDPGGVGTATSYDIRYSTSPILTLADFELAQRVGGVTPVPSAAGTPEGMTVTGLVPGVDYWFAIMATDDAYYSTLSNSDSDPAGMGFMAYQPAGTYEDTDAFMWLYGGVWSTYLYPAASNGDEHVCNAPGSTAIFLFNGSGFTLTYQTKSAFSGLTVYVDGVKVGSINQKSTFIVWQKTATFTGFGAGNHTLQFVCGGAANVDAITILP